MSDGFPNATFLSGQALSDAVRFILGGSRLRCAVAFIGLGFADALADEGADISKVRVLCNVTMGGTSPDALLELGAPTRKRLKHHPSLHAKVYLSDRGVIVGSANASENGLGFGTSGPGVLEAGTIHEAGGPIWNAALAWFDGIYGKAGRVDRDALGLARNRFARHPPSGVRAQTRKGSLLDMVRARPGDFRDVGFVIASKRPKPVQLKKSREAAVNDGIAEIATIKDAPDEGIFAGWDTRDAARWRTSFIEFWMPRERLSVYYRSVIAIHRERGDIYSCRDPETLAALLPSDVPARASSERLDADQVASLRDAGKTFFSTASDLAAALDML